MEDASGATEFDRSDLTAPEHFRDRRTEQAESVSHVLRGVRGRRSRLRPRRRGESGLGGSERSPRIG